MRTSIFFLIAFLNVSSLVASPPETGDKAVMLNERFQITTKKKEAVYVATMVNQAADGFFFKIHYLSGELKMEGYYADQEMLEPNGVFTFYYKNGQIESVGEYADGSKFGIWQRFDSTGLALTNKIYTSQQMMDAITAE